MSGNPREHAKNKGFWDGGSPAHNAGNQAAGRNSGFPGRRRSSRVGVRTDLEAPATTVKPTESPLGRTGK